MRATGAPGDPTPIVKRFEEIILRAIETCVEKYNLKLRDKPTSPEDAISLLRAAIPEGTPIFVFIDEYDTPFNSLVLRSPIKPEEKKKAMEPLKASYDVFLKALKSANTRNYLTGVLNIHVPGFTGLTPNRASFSPDWHALSGYTEADVKDLLAQVRALLPEKDPRLELFEEKVILPIITEAYNGYWFAIRDKKQSKVYNADMVNHFVRFTLDRRDYPRGKELLSEAVSLSDNVLAFAASLPWHSGLLINPMMPDFGLRDPISSVLNMDKILDIYYKLAGTTDMFWQILYSFGALTTKQVGADGSNLLIGTPNDVVRDEFLTTTSEMIQGDAKRFGIAREAFLEMLQSGDPSKFVKCFYAGDILITTFSERRH